MNGPAPPAPASGAQPDNTVAVEAASTDTGPSAAPAAVKTAPPRTIAASPLKLAEAQQRAGIDQLLRVEAEARKASAPSELIFLMANETLRVARCRQIFIVDCRNARRVRMKGVSSVAHVDRNAPRIRWIESIVAALGRDAGLDEARAFELPAYTPPADEEHKTFPFRHMLWIPFLLANGERFAGMLLAREIPWPEPDQLIAKRLGETYAHAWAALSGPRKLTRRFRPAPALAAVSAAGLVAAGFVPVPLTVLAPLEIVAVSSKVVASPLDGTIASIEAEPNAAVAKGAVIVRLADTALRNEAAVAAEEVAVAETRLRLVSQGAIGDPKMRRELAVTRADVALKRARLDYANDMLARSVVNAPASGIAVYADRREWIGRPVQTGERILEIADSSLLEFKIEVPVADSVAIEAGAAVRAFIDSDPLNPVDAKVRDFSYEAKPTPEGGLAYTVHASAAGNAPDNLRLGVRGTAQISGDDVPLAYWLFRRPVTTVRQWLGW